MSALALSRVDARRERPVRLFRHLRCPACGAVTAPNLANSDGSVWYRCSAFPHPGGVRRQTWRVTCDGRVLSGWTGRRVLAQSVEAFRP